MIEDPLGKQIKASYYTCSRQCTSLARYHANTAILELKTLEQRLTYQCYPAILKDHGYLKVKSQLGVPERGCKGRQSLTGAIMAHRSWIDDELRSGINEVLGGARARTSCSVQVRDELCLHDIRD
jgi:hypothetical protein